MQNFSAKDVREKLSQKLFLKKLAIFSKDTKSYSTNTRFFINEAKKYSENFAPSVSQRPLFKTFFRILKVRGSVLKVRGSVLKFKSRFGRFEVRLSEVREVQGSEYSGSTQY